MRSRCVGAGRKAGQGRTRQAEILAVNRLRPEPGKIRRAAAVIRAGGIAAFPTETVYGLAADAFNPDAVRKVFMAKGRPQDNPLIVHIAEKKDLKLVAKKPSAKAAALIRRFWPGPLTVVLPKKKRLPSMVTAGGDTVAVRLPANRIARALIRAAGTPLAAPSANLSGRPSPTRRNDVVQDLGDRIDCILDGGKTDLGIESTVVDMTVSPPLLLRPGAVTVEEIEAVIGPIRLLEPEGQCRRGPVRSPGLKYRHYAPCAEMMAVDGPPELVAKTISELAEKAFQKGRKVGIICFHSDRCHPKGAVVRAAGTFRKASAKRIYQILRDLDRSADLILSELPTAQGAGRAVADRLLKAAGNRIVTAGR